MTKRKTLEENYEVIKTLVLKYRKEFIKVATIMIYYNNYIPHAYSKKTIKAFVNNLSDKELIAIIMVPGLSSTWEIKWVNKVLSGKYSIDEYCKCIIDEILEDDEEERVKVCKNWKKI